MYIPLLILKIQTNSLVEWVTNQNGLFHAVYSKIPSLNIYMCYCNMMMTYIYTLQDKDQYQELYAHIVLSQKSVYQTTKGQLHA